MEAMNACGVQGPWTGQIHEKDAKSPGSADINKPTQRNSSRRNGLMEIARHTPGPNFNQEC